MRRGVKVSKKGFRRGAREAKGAPVDKGKE